jgi:iron complex transport system substrate-binding protein
MELHRPLTRRNMLQIGALALAGLGVAACSTDATPAGASAGATTTPGTNGGSGAATTSGSSTAAGPVSSAAVSSAASSTAASSAAAAGFPISVEHKYGTTSIAKAPTRVLSLGYTDHEVLLALGIVPIGVIQWIPEWKRGVGPWSEAALKGATPALFQYELDFEKAAALKPDLILNIGFDPDQKTYDTLSAIAPTIAPPAGTKPYGVAWEEMTTMVSTAVGRAADGRQLIADTKALLAKTAAANPQFDDKTFVVAGPYQGKLGYYEKTDIRAQLLHELGLVDNKLVASRDGADFFSTLSGEQAAQLDADVLIMFGDAGTTQASMLKTFPALAAVPVVKEGRLIYLTDSEISMAFSTASVLSIPVALDAVVPKMKAVL